METAENDTHRRILSAADELFSARGYGAVTLRDIGDAVGMRHASLYYYAPGGKEQLFVEVMARNLRRHNAGLQAAMAAAEPDIRAQLHAVAEWLLQQPPMDLVRMIHADMPAIDAHKARELTELVYAMLIQPVEVALQRAIAAGEIAHDEPEVVAAGIVALVESLHAVPAYALQDVERERRRLAHSLLNVMLNGLRPR